MDEIEIVERAARAAYEKFNEGLLGGLEPHWEDLEPSFKDRMMAAQHAAIKAMREPTTKMLRASTAQIPTWDDDVSRRKWQAMIDALFGQ